MTKPVYQHIRQIVWRSAQRTTQRATGRYVDRKAQNELYRKEEWEVLKTILERLRG